MTIASNAGVDAMPRKLEFFAQRSESAIVDVCEYSAAQFGLVGFMKVGDSSVTMSIVDLFRVSNAICWRAAALD